VLQSTPHPSPFPETAEKVFTNNFT
jgi:hypothetical protein